jgi:hypothetical protein
MSLRCSRLVTLTVATLALSAALAQARFEPLVQVTGLAGEAFVTEPGAASPVPVMMDKAYPYRSAFKTADDSSLTIQFSEGNICSLLPNTTASFKENKKRGKVKTVELSIGKVELQLSADLAKHNEQVLVLAPGASITGLDCHFRVDAAADGEHRVVVVRAIRGTATVNGDYIAVRALPEGSSMSFYSSVDMSYLRLVNIKGEFRVVVRDDSGDERFVDTVPGSVIKVWRRPVPESTQVMVAIMLTNAKGAAISFKDESGNVIGNTVTGVYSAGETLSGAPLSSPGADGHENSTTPEVTRGPNVDETEPPSEAPGEVPAVNPAGAPPRRNPQGPFPRNLPNKLQRLVGTTTTQYIPRVTPVGEF